jgi:hypothetical protein
MQKNLSNLNDEELQEYRMELERRVARYNNLQLAKKVSL